MGIILEQQEPRPSLTRYEPEYNEDGSEKHVCLDGARFHSSSWLSDGEHCSEPNCEINHRRKARAQRI